MEGKIKWFSSDKGFGFIHGEDEVDRYFSIRDVIGSELPKNGDSVVFEHRDGKKGPRATNISISDFQRARQTSSNKKDDRVTCKKCQKNMIPRIITGPPLVTSGHWTPVPKRSVCPFCAHTYQKFPASLGQKILHAIFIIVFVTVFSFILFGVLR